MNYEKGTPEWILQDSCILYCKAREILIGAEAVYKDVDSQTKTQLAFAMLECSPAWPVNKQEREASTSKLFTDHLKALSEARKDYLKARGGVDIQDKRWETARSLLSMEKAKAAIR